MFATLVNWFCAELVDLQGKGGYLLRFLRGEFGLKSGLSLSFKIVMYGPVILDWLSLD